MKNLAILVYLLLFSISISGQDTIPISKSSPEFFKEVSIFIELAGNGIPYSANLEVVIFEKQNKLISRAGFSYLPVMGSKLIIIPIEVACLLGANRNYLELGAGIDLIFESYSGGSAQYLRYVPRIGYRHYNVKGNRYIRVGYTPILDISAYGLGSEGSLHLPVWFGFGFGFIL